MKNLFEEQTSWTDAGCYYVAALSGFRRAWLAGPYPTRGMAEDVLPRAVRWCCATAATSWPPATNTASSNTITVMTGASSGRSSREARQ